VPGPDTEQVIDRFDHEPGVDPKKEVLLEVRDRNELPIHVPSGNPYWILVSKHMDDAATGDLLLKLGVGIGGVAVDAHVKSPPQDRLVPDPSGTRKGELKYFYF
jgi:hypothetical protein